ncbi:hypothetical protein MRX96_036298 [Rhipicephalus microplus]
MNAQTSKSARSERTFGQVVIGPPGSGKSTYCKAMRELCTAIGRSVAVVNLDPANDVLPYEADVDIKGLVELSDAMDFWRKFAAVTSLSTVLVRWNSTRTTRACGMLCLNFKSWATGFRPPTLSTRTTVAILGKFISVLLTSLATMMHMELPHINVLSKVDLAEQYGKLHFGLDYYTDVMDLSFLADVLSEDPILKKYKKMNEALAGIIEDYSLVSFMPLNVQEKESMWSVLKACDKCNGYIFSQSEEQHMMNLAMGSDTQSQDVISRLRERLETSGTTCIVEDEADMDDIA